MDLFRTGLENAYASSELLFPYKWPRVSGVEAISFKVQILPPSHGGGGGSTRANPLAPVPPKPLAPPAEGFCCRSKNAHR